MKRSALAAGSLAALFVLTACSSSSGAGKTTSPTSAPASASTSMSMSMSMPAPPGSATSKVTAAANTITIDNFSFSGSMTVKPGAKVKVVNQDSTAHTLTDKATHKFDTGNIAAGGGTGTFTAPTKPGRYPFGCTYHPQMAGTLIVAG